MANAEHLDVFLNRDTWRWRLDHPGEALDLSGADLSGCRRAGVNAPGANLRSANLANASLTRANLEGSDLRGANLAGATLGSRLVGALFDDAILEKAELRRADLTGARLEGAQLRNADLSDAKLVNASLVGADLTGATLARANLGNADLRGAVLAGVRAGGATLDGAKLDADVELDTTVEEELPPAPQRGPRLSLRDHGLTRLPDEVCERTELEVLDLSGNALVSLPRSLGQLRALRELNLSNNRLESLPEELGELQALQTLRAANNRLAAVPAALWLSPSLATLGLEGNRLRTLPELPGGKPRCGLHSLAIDGNELEALPETLGRMTDLVHLTACNNRLEHLPESLAQLRSLRVLRLANNSVSELVDGVGDLAALEHLDLAKNRLEIYPARACDLPALRVLDLRSNRLGELPPEIARMVSLEELDLRDNRLTSLPPEIASLGNLQKLTVHEHQSTPLPLSSIVKKWDVFVSYSREDKDVAAELAEKLKRAGLAVWFDDKQVALGDSIRQSIDAGLAASRFGVILLSRSYAKKLWPQRELNALLAREESGQKVVLPVWHGITHTELVELSPLLADRSAVDTRDGLTNVAGKIRDVVLHLSSDSPSALFPSPAKRIVDYLDRGDLAGLRVFLLRHPEIPERVLRARVHALETPFDVPAIHAEHYYASGHQLAKHWLVLAGPHVAGPDVGYDELRHAVERAAAVTAQQTGAMALERGQIEFPIRAGERWEPNKAGPSLLIRHPTVVLSSRRSLLFEGDRRWFDELNELSPHVQVRTYDTLIDAALHRA